MNTPESPYSQSIQSGAPQQLGLSVEQMLEITKRDVRFFEKKLTAEYRVSKKDKPVSNRTVVKTIQRRAKLAGLTNEYESMYRMYSKPTHGDIGSMLWGVIDGNSFVWPPIDRPPSSMAINLATRMLIDAGQLLAKKWHRHVAPFNSVESRRKRWVKQVYGVDE